MKSALVLGLALTASAFSAEQFDNELIIAPTDQFGNIKNYPRNIRFDEQTDDELVVKRPGFLQVADDELRIAPTDEFLRTKPYPPNIRFEEEGNKLFSFSFDIPRYRNLTNRFPGMYADDELMRGPYQRRRRSHDGERRKDFHDEVDNEFAFSPYRITVPSGGKKENDNGADNEYAARVKAAAKKYRPGLVEHVNQHPETVFFDEADDEFNAKNAMGGLKPKLFAQRRAEALREDDELLARPGYLQIADDELIRPPKNKNKNGNVVYDDEVDNELHSNYKMSSKLFVERRAEALRRDDGVDDELHITRPQQLPRPAPISKIIHSLADKLIGAPPSDQKVIKTVKHDDELMIRPIVPYIIADDELHRMSSKLFTERRAEALRRDDGVDDELHTIGIPKCNIIRTMGSKLIGAPPSDKKETKNVNPDDEIDDELLVRPVVPYVTADEELHKMSPKLFTERRAEALRRDDEVDDELALLDDLLQEVSYNGGLIRWLDDSDDEFRAEKVAHLKDRVRDHEMPEIRRKVKPLGDGGFLPFN